MSANGKPFMHGGPGRTGKRERKKRSLDATDTEWDRVRAEADREGVGISDCIHRRFRQTDPEDVKGNIPGELEFEALVAIIHLHALHESLHAEGGKAEHFNDLRDRVKQRFAPGIYEELVTEEMRREGMLAALHLHELFRDNHDKVGDSARFEATLENVEQSLTFRGLLGPGRR